MSTIVIGIHGLLNKPPREVLKSWWRDALLEGLGRNLGRTAPDLDFDLAYWADVRNSAPVPDDEQEEPYVEAAGAGPLRRYVPGLGDGARSLAQKWGGRTLDKAKDLFGIGPGVEKLLSVKLADLGDYYEKAEIRGAIRDRLDTILREKRGRRVQLIAHSMGSIIAHDVLRAAEGTDLHVEHWITIGSPLGLPLVSRKIREEFGEQRTPANVDRWTNLSDPGDKVALDCNLRDEFPAGPRRVRVEDVLLHNGYVSPRGEPNNHKSYGYLRAPELSDRVQAFLGA